METVATVLEYSAFSSSLLCVFCYGNSQKIGATMGMVTAALFITWGSLTGVQAALYTNLIFMVLHFRNFRKAKLNETVNLGTR